MSKQSKLARRATTAAMLARFRLPEILTFVTDQGQVRSGGNRGRPPSRSPGTTPLRRRRNYCTTDDAATDPVPGGYSDATPATT